MISVEVDAVEMKGGPHKAVKDILTLKEDRTMDWTEDLQWEEKMRLEEILPIE